MATEKDVINIITKYTNSLQTYQHKEFDIYLINSHVVIGLKRSEKYPHLFLFMHGSIYILSDLNIFIIEEDKLLNLLDNEELVTSSNILRIDSTYYVISNIDALFFAYKNNIFVNSLCFSDIDNLFDYYIFKIEKNKSYSIFKHINDTYINLPLRIPSDIFNKKKFIKANEKFYHLELGNIKKNRKCTRRGYYFYIYFDDQEFNYIISRYKEEDEFDIYKYLYQ